MLATQNSNKISDNIVTKTNDDDEIAVQTMPCNKKLHKTVCEIVNVKASQHPFTLNFRQQTTLQNRDTTGISNGYYS